MDIKKYLQCAEELHKTSTYYHINIAQKSHLKHLCTWNTLVVWKPKINLQLHCVTLENDFTTWSQVSTSIDYTSAGMNLGIQRAHL